MNRSGLQLLARLGLLALSAALALGGVARAQEKPMPDGTPGQPQKPDTPKTDTAPPPPEKDGPTKPHGTPPPSGDAPRKDGADAAPRADNKAPDPSKAALVGELLPAGTVSRKGLFPLDDGRRWKYDLKTWLTPTTGEDGAPADESEPPRAHKLDVSVTEPIKIEGREARCLEYKLDDEPAQRAYYFDDGAGIVCPKRVLGAGEHQHDFPLLPPQPTLSADLTVGAAWDWKGKVGSSNGKQSFKILREEGKVVTKAGTFDTLVIQCVFEGDDDSKGVSTKWFAPGVGIVREETEVRADQQIYRTVAVLSKIESKK